MLAIRGDSAPLTGDPFVLVSSTYLQLGAGVNHYSQISDELLGRNFIYTNSNVMILPACNKYYLDLICFHICPEKSIHAHYLLKTTPRRL